MNDSHADTPGRSMLGCVNRPANAFAVGAGHGKFTFGALCAAGSAWKYDLLANREPKKFA